MYSNPTSAGHVSSHTELGYIHTGPIYPGYYTMKTRSSDSPGPNAATSDEALTPSQFRILLTLAESSCHGYGIMQKIECRTDGAVELGPGTLYRSINQLLARGLIVEGDGGGDPQPETGRKRRSYILTPRGKARTAEEAQRLRALLLWADDAIGLEGGRP